MHGKVAIEALYGCFLLKLSLGLKRFGQVGLVFENRNRGTSLHCKAGPAVGQVEGMSSAIRVSAMRGPSNRLGRPVL